MKCVHCQGRMTRKTAPFQVDRKGYHLYFESVPAWVCDQCGEAYFEEQQVEEIQELIQTVDDRVGAMTSSASSSTEEA